MDINPPHSLVVVVVGVVGQVHKNRYFHSLVNNRASLVGHVVVLIFGGIVHKSVVDKLWLMDFSWHKFNVIIMAGSAILTSVVLTFT